VSVTTSNCHILYKIENINIRTVTGASTRCTLLSSTNISLARRHKALTSPSRRYSHRLSRSICSSSSLLLLPLLFEILMEGAVEEDGILDFGGLVF